MPTAAKVRGSTRKHTRTAGEREQYAPTVANDGCAAEGCTAALQLQAEAAQSSDQQSIRMGIDDVERMEKDGFHLRPASALLDIVQRAAEHRR